METLLALPYNGTFWFVSGLAIIGVSIFVFDILDHGMYLGIPAIFTGLLLGISPPESFWFQHQIWTLATYGVMVLLFYAICYRHFNKQQKNNKDINEHDNNQLSD